MDFSALSTYNSTLEIPEPSSVAEIEAVIIPFIVSALLGFVTCATGALVSLTVTVNEALPMLLEESVALHETVVVPNANVEPDDGAHVVARAPSTLSVAVACG